MVQTYLTWTGVLIATGTILYSGFVVIRKFILAFDNLDTILTNHLPHIYTELKAINEKLFHLAKGEHETREDQISN